MPDGSTAGGEAAETTALGVLFAVSASHLLNDTMQSLAPALYPVFRDRMALTFFQTGVITFVFQISASLLQPLIGLAADRRPMSRSCRPAWPSRCSASSVARLRRRLSAAARFCRGDRRRQRGLPSGGFAHRPGGVRGRHGFAQSLFQVGGNFGQSTGPFSPPSSSFRSDRSRCSPSRGSPGSPSGF